MSASPFTKRLAKKLSTGLCLKGKFTLEDAAAAQKAFVEALREEVAERYDVTGPPSHEVAGSLNRNLRIPLVIAGLGSFKMVTRPERKFSAFRYAPDKSLFGNDGPGELISKPPSRKLHFTAKWEPIK